MSWWKTCSDMGWLQRVNDVTMESKLPCSLYSEYWKAKESFEQNELNTEDCTIQWLKLLRNDSIFQVLHASLRNSSTVPQEHEVWRACRWVDCAVRASGCLGGDRCKVSYKYGNLERELAKFVRRHICKTVATCNRAVDWKSACILQMWSTGPQEGSSSKKMRTFGSGASSIEWRKVSHNAECVVPGICDGIHQCCTGLQCKKSRMGW